MPEGGRSGELAAGAQASALAELALCENLAQTSGWAARWSFGACRGGRRAAVGPRHGEPSLPLHRSAREGDREVAAARGRSNRRGRARPGPGPQADRSRPGRPRRGGRGSLACGTSSGRAGLPRGSAGGRGRRRGPAGPALPPRRGRRRDPRPTGGLLTARGPGSRQGTALRAQDGRHVARDRAADEPLRPLQGVRVHHRHGGAQRAHRAQGGRPRGRGDSLPLAPRRGRGAPRGDRPQRELRRRARPGGGRWPCRRRPRRRPGDVHPGGDSRGRPPSRREPRIRPAQRHGDPSRRGGRPRWARSFSPTSAAGIPSSPPRTRSCSRTSAGRRSAPSASRGSTRPRRRSRSSTRCSPSSREITATLDLDKVMRTVVNATAALIRYDRCAIAVQDRGRLRLGAVSGVMELDRKSPDIRRTEELLQWVFLSGVDVAVTVEEDGSLTHRPARDGGEVPRLLPGERPEVVLRRPPEGRRGQARRRRFREQGPDRLRRRDPRSAADPRQPGDGRGPQRPALPAGPPRGILEAGPGQAAQAPGDPETAGGWPGPPEPPSCSWCCSSCPGGSGSRDRRASSPRAGRRSPRGWTESSPPSYRREGETVRANDVIAALKDEKYQASLADALADSRIAASDMARHLETGDAPSMFAAQSRRDETAARVALAREEVNRTRLVAPTSGVILTPRLEERVGQSLARGEEFCRRRGRGRGDGRGGDPGGGRRLRPGGPPRRPSSSTPIRRGRSRPPSRAWGRGFARRATGGSSSPRSG